jgi:hypothetical protein
MRWAQQVLEMTALHGGYMLNVSCHNKATSESALLRGTFGAEMEDEDTCTVK